MRCFDRSEWNAGVLTLSLLQDPYIDLINPAVNGTLNLLKSAIKEPKIQRVVITSSFAGALNGLRRRQE